MSTLLTEEQCLELDRAAEDKSEYYDGEMFAMAGAGMNHNIHCDEHGLWSSRAASRKAVFRDGERHAIADRRCRAIGISRHYGGVPRP